jgi:hypothetical protein
MAERINAKGSDMIREEQYEELSEDDRPNRKDVYQISK